MFQNSTTLDILLERFQCTPLGPKLKFLVFSHHFGALKCPFGFAPHTLRLKLVFRVISRPFVAAPGPLLKSVSGAFNSRVFASETISFFCRKHAQSTTLGLKLKFWMVSRHFVAAPDPLRKLISGCIKKA